MSGHHFLFDYFSMCKFKRIKFKKIKSILGYGDES